jgi:hypothetical protein
VHAGRQHTIKPFRTVLRRRRNRCGGGEEPSLLLSSSLRSGRFSPRFPFPTLLFHRHFRSSSSVSVDFDRLLLSPLSQPDGASSSSFSLHSDSNLQDGRTCSSGCVYPARSLSNSRSFSCRFRSCHVRPHLPPSLPNTADNNYAGSARCNHTPSRTTQYLNGSRRRWESMACSSSLLFFLLVFL